METLQRTANRGSISTGYDIDNSLKLEPDNSENMYRALNASTSTTTFTHSQWVKRTEIGGSQLLYMRGVAGNESVVLRFATENASYPEALQVDIGASGTNSRSYTKAAFRDTAAFYHIVLAVDTTQATATDRFKLYVNGVLEDDYAARANPTQNFAMEVSSAKHRYGAYNDTDNFAPFAGYLAECHYIDGSQLAPTDFGEFDEDSGIWKPKAYAGSYGTGGYYLDFEASGDLGANTEGDDVNFTLNNITSADQATDTPTNNFCTWNVNYNYTIYAGNPTLTEGATKTQEGTGGWAQSKATMGVTSGKWYWEYKMGGSLSHMGVQDDTASQTEFAGQYTLFLYNGDTTVEINDSGSLRDDTVLSYTFSASDIYAVALNMDDNEISYYQNGSIIGSAISLDGLADRLLLPYGGTNSSTNEVNFGGFTTISISSAASDANGYGTFEYAPPSGYYALCTKNLAEFG